MNGKPVRIGDRDFIVPDATIETAENIAIQLEAMGGGGVRRPMVVARLIATAIQENYPEMTEVEVGRMLRFSKSAATLKAVLQAAGLEMGAGEVQAP